MPATWRGCVVAIGNFDGVHRGHQAVLLAAKAEAERRGVASLMLTLEPHPRAFFSGRPIFRLTPPPLKGALAQALGLDGTIVLTFDRALADQSAQDFVDALLVGRLGVAAAVTGPGFRFGKARQGTAHYLAEQGAEAGFSVIVVDPATDGDEAVSSTRIRKALAEGDVETAFRLFGRRHAVVGTVVHGDGRGHGLGYPTANIVPDPASELAHGIYAVRVARADGNIHDGVASFGRRPTFGGGDPVLEVFLFDFSGDLYGEALLVTFYGFVRGEEHFDSADALVARMEQDSIEARALLQRLTPNDLDRRVAEVWAAAAVERQKA